MWPDEFLVKRHTLDLANFSFDNKDKCPMSKVDYLKHKIITFLDESQETLSELNFTNKLLPILETYQEQQQQLRQQTHQQKEVTITKEIEQTVVPSRSTLKEKINVFKETLNNSLNSSITNSQVQYMSSMKKQINILFNLNCSGNEGNDIGDNTKPRFVRAMYQYKGEIEKDLSFSKGDIIEVLEIHTNGWCTGKNVKTSKQGYFPANFVEPIKTNNRSNNLLK